MQDRPQETTYIEELVLRNKQLSKLNEIAFTINTLKTESEIFSYIVEAATRIPGIHFVIAEKLVDRDKFLMTRYHSSLHNSNFAMLLKSIGLSSIPNPGPLPPNPDFAFEISKIPAAREFMKNPQIQDCERLSDLLAGVWDAATCDRIQKALSLKKITIVPLKADNDIWGCILFFQEKDIGRDILEVIAVHCQNAVFNGYTLEKLRKNNQELSAVNMIAALTSRSMEMNKIIEKTLSSLKQVYSASGVSVYLLNEAENSLELVGQTGMTEEILKHSRKYDLRHPFSTIISSQKPLFGGNLSEYMEIFAGSQYDPSDPNIWFLSAPLVCNGKRIGNVNIIRPSKDNFSEEEKALLVTISAQLSIAFENSILHDNLLARIKELEETQNRLSLSEQKIRMTLESVSDGIVVISLDGRIIQANSVAIRMLGYDGDSAFMGRPALRYVNPDERKKMLENLKKVIQSGIVTVAECELIRKDESRFPAECGINPYKSSIGEIKGLVIWIKDITKRKLDKKRLQESERKYRLIAENTTDLISMISFSGYYNYVSPSIRQLGYEPEDLLNKYCMDIIDPESGKSILPVLLKLTQMDSSDLARLKQNNYSQRLEYKIKDKWGNWHDFLGTGNVIESLDGQGCNFLVISRDVTDLKQAQLKLKEAYDSEKETRQALENEIKKRGDFFRALVHELKTPLTPIIVSSETIMELNPVETFKNLARNVYDSANRLNSRVEELLDINRGELGMLKIHLEPVNMGLLINNIVQSIAYQAEKNKHMLLIDMPESLPQIMGDEGRLRQVLLNLLDNAMKFTPDGGQITIKARQDEKNLTVVVRDTGRGIDESEISRIFQPYNRIEEDRQHFSGLGLGLALCKQLIDLHKGKIWVESQKNRGTSFCFSLPALPNAFAPTDKQTALEYAAYHSI